MITVFQVLIFVLATAAMTAVFCGIGSGKKAALLGAGAGALSATIIALMGVLLASLS